MNRFRLNRNLRSGRSESLIRVLSGLLLSCAVAVSAVSCTNAISKKLSKTSLGFNKSNLDATGTPLITITKVVRNNRDPSGTFDIIGDNTFAMGNYCVSTESGDNSALGASACTCSYEYTLPTTDGSLGATELLEVDTTYHEGNLIRCSFHDIPSAVTSVKVRVRVPSMNNISDPYTFDFQETGTALDTTAISTFSRVYRYTCRDIVTIENLFDTKSSGGTGIYDPIQSEDPRNSYPLNFYTTNLGATMNAYAGGVSGISAPALWECPANPLNPPSPYQLTIYSQSALSGGDKVISSGTNMNANNPRSTFYLAKARTSVFQIPFNAYIAPTIHSNPLDSQGKVQGIPPLGYGASPVSTGTPGQETCPDASVAIPSGYHWAKVWLFRMALPTRKFLTSSKFAQLGNISCHPGQWDPMPSPAYSTSYFNVPFNDCNGALSLDGKGVATALVARFFEGTAMCVKPAAGGTTNSSGALVAPYSSWLPQVGSDKWVPNNGYPVYGCTGTNPIDPTNVCEASPGNLAYDPSPTARDLDSPSNPRFDFIFVTTPATVMSADMSDSSSSVYAQYAPYRFRADSDCGVADPDAASCDPQNAFRTYGIKFHDVGSAGDPPADNPNRAGVFPVCALQPN